jgi:hypothetical protein
MSAPARAGPGPDGTHDHETHEPDTRDRLLHYGCNGGPHGVGPIKAAAGLHIKLVTVDQIGLAKLQSSLN